MMLLTPLRNATNSTGLSTLTLRRGTGLDSPQVKTLPAPDGVALVVVNARGKHNAASLSERCKQPRGSEGIAEWWRFERERLADLRHAVPRCWCAGGGRESAIHRRGSHGLQ